MGTFTATVTVLVALSMASERIIEVLKKILPSSWLADAWTGDNENRRQVLLQALSGTAGGLIAWASHNEIATMIPSMAQFLGWPAYVLLGLLSSAGSRFWNHILDAMRAIKIEREARAELQVRALNEQRAAAKQKAFAKAAA